MSQQAGPSTPQSAPAGTDVYDRALEIEQYTIAQIPEDQRHGRPRDLFTIWFTSNLIPLAIVTGALATVAFGLPFWPALVAIALGNLVGGLFMALHSAQGPRLGVPRLTGNGGRPRREDETEVVPALTTPPWLPPSVGIRAGQSAWA